MWVAKFILEATELQETIVDRLMKKYKLTSIGYPLTTYEENGKYFSTMAGFVKGPKNKIRNLFKEIKKDPKVKHFEVKKDLITLQIESNFYLNELHDPHFITVSPTLATPDGKEIWELGSWDREKLTKLIEILKKKYNIKLLNLSQKKLNYLSMIQVIPSLTEKQKRALILAIDNGYYKTPRQIELKQLAKLMNISFSTYKQHLHRTEEKFFERAKTAI